MDQKNVYLGKNNTHEISVRFIFITICLNCTTDKKGFVLYSIDFDD